MMYLSFSANTAVTWYPPIYENNSTLEIWNYFPFELKKLYNYSIQHLKDMNRGILHCLLDHSRKRNLFSVDLKKYFWLNRSTFRYSPRIPVLNFCKGK